MDKPVNVNVNELETFLCPNCEYPYCTEVFTLRHLPALLSPNGKEQVLKVPVGYSCNRCNSGMFGKKIEDNEDKKPLLDLVK